MPLVQLFRINKPIGTLLLLWPTLLALWFAADGWPSWHNVVIFVLGVVVMRAVGCAVNDYLDRHIDRLVTRTKNRPLAQHSLKLSHARTAIIILLLLALGLAIQLHPRTICLALLGGCLVFLYPLAKRFVACPQLVLGITFGWGIPMAYMEQLGLVPATGWLLYMANICWVVAYDTEYAMVDMEDDVYAGINSSALLFGSKRILVIGFLQIVALCSFVWLGIACQRGYYFYGGCMLAAGSMVYQQQLLWSGNTERYFKAFLHNNYVGLSLFVGTALDYV